MIKRFPVLLIVLAFVNTFAIAQNRNVQIKEAVITDDNVKWSAIDNSNESFFVPEVAGDVMLNTGYDLLSNNQARKMLQMFDIDVDGSLDPMMVAMRRMVEGGDRHCYFAYKAFGFIDAFNAFDPTQTPFGWPEIQYCDGGPNDGDALVMGHVSPLAYHSWIDLVSLAPRTPYPTTTFGDPDHGVWPSFVYLGSLGGTILGVSGINPPAYPYIEMVISTDGGATFDSLQLIGDGDSKVNMAGATGFPAEFPLVKSLDDNVIATVACVTNGAANPTGNKYDPVYWYGSTDAGATWEGKFYGFGYTTTGTNHVVYGQISNRDYAPYFCNFEQVSMIIDQTGVSHLLANGYGEGLYMGGTDTVNTYPMLYSNSNMLSGDTSATWIAITDELMEAPADPSGDLISDYYPGNAIGNAYGTIAANNTGQILFAVWMGPEYASSVIGDEFNIYPGDGGTASTPMYYTDLYYSFSEDGGATWSTVGILEGEQEQADNFPVLWDNITIVGDQATAYYIYYVDPLPGVSVQSGGPQNGFDANGAWIYNSFTWTLSTSVNEDIVVDNFNLEQNYPNPFNPSTTIKYGIPERTFVELRIFDILGREVELLVNKEQDAGNYKIDFNAGKLASGIYLYKLKAGDFVETKKMVLMK